MEFISVTMSTCLSYFGCDEPLTGKADQIACLLKDS